MADRQKNAEHVISMIAKFEGKLGEHNVRERLLTMNDTQVSKLIARLDAAGEKKAAAAARELRIFLGFRKEPTTE